MLPKLEKVGDESGKKNRLNEIRGPGDSVFAHEFNNRIHNAKALQYVQNTSESHGAKTSLVTPCQGNQPGCETYRKASDNLNDESLLPRQNSKRSNPRDKHGKNRRDKQIPPRTLKPNGAR
jgi:hypothetical protein